MIFSGVFSFLSFNHIQSSVKMRPIRGLLIVCIQAYPIEVFRDGDVEEVEDGGGDIVDDRAFVYGLYSLKIEHGIVVGMHTAQGAGLKYQAFLQTGF